MWWAGLANVPPPAPHAAERSFSLAYTAPASCPSAEALAQSIEARTPGAWQQPTREAAVQLRVQLRDDGRSTLWVELPEGVSRREFPHAECARTANTIAIISAMLLDADTLERPSKAQALLQPR